MRPPRTVQRGEAVRADDFNALVHAVGGITRSRGGRGLSVSAGINGLLISLLGPRKDRVVWCKITAAPPYGVPIMPSNCRYSVRALDKSFEMANATPEYGRQVENDECAVYPDKVGRFCAVIRNKTGGVVKAELWVFRENPARGPC